MKKHFRKSTIRTISLMLSCILLICSMAVPASADLMDDMVVNGLDYVYSTETSYSSDSVLYGMYFTTDLSAIYIDATIRTAYDAQITGVVGANNEDDGTLELNQFYSTVEDGFLVRFYHIYGMINLDTSVDPLLAFIFSGSFPQADCIDFLSLSFTNGNVQRLTETVNFRYDFNSKTGTTTQTSTSFAGWNVPATGGAPQPFILTTTADRSIWAQYDYAEFLYRVGAQTVSSVHATVGQVAVPCYVQNITGTSYTENTDFVFRVVVDLRGVKNESGQLSVSVRGNAACHSNSWFYLVSNNWIFLTSPQDPVVSILNLHLSDIVTRLHNWQLSFDSHFTLLFSRLSTISSELSDGFVSLGGSLSDLYSAVSTFFTTTWNEFTMDLSSSFDAVVTAIFLRSEAIIDAINNGLGTKDRSGQAAQQTQDELNVSMNNQIVGAVENWDTHIAVVHDGSDLAFMSAGPALIWLGSLADRIFTNMGWFNSIYLMVGLFSVFMLILSKSGIAHKIGGAIRRSGK